MKRFYAAVLLTLLGSSAFAGDSNSFGGGRRAQYEPSRDCRSASCSAPSRYGRDRHRDDDDDDYYNDDRRRTDRRTGDRTLPPTQEVEAPPAIVTRKPAVYRPAAATTQDVAPPQARLAVPPAPPPPLASPHTAKPAEPARSAPVNPPQVASDDADAPLGDWQTEAKGMVRIVRCGKAFCGYVLSSSSNDQGEIVLVNMKPKSDEQWTGSIYSQASGDTYYGTMEMKSPHTLRVEACAVGRFYCSGNNWSRVDGRAESLLSSRTTRVAPRS